MKKRLLQIISTFFILMLLKQGVYADMISPGPPTEAISTISLGIVIGLGGLVAIIVIFVVLGIRAAKKEYDRLENTPKDQ